MKDSFETEKRLLGKMMSNSRDYYDNHSLITERIFLDPLNRKIYKAISSRLDKGSKPDILDITTSIKDPLCDVRLAECMASDHYAYLTKNMVLFLLEQDKKESLKRLVEHTNKKINNNDDLFDIIQFLEDQIKSNVTQRILYRCCYI